MKKLVGVKFEYDDGSYDEIIDPRACLLVQSRCNSSGVFSGMEDYFIIHEKGEVKSETVE